MVYYIGDVMYISEGTIIAVIIIIVSLFVCFLLLKNTVWVPELSATKLTLLTIGLAFVLYGVLRVEGESSNLTIIGKPIPYFAYTGYPGSIVYENVRYLISGHHGE